MGKLNFLALCAQVFQNRVNAFFIYDAHTFGRNPQAYKTVLTLNPETMIVQIRHKTASRFVVRMGDIVSSDGALARYLTYFRHFGINSIKVF